jgi:hypothetical protein
MVVEVKGGAVVDAPKTLEKKKHVLQLINAAGEIYFFQAQNDHDYQAWFECFIAETKYVGTTRAVSVAVSDISSCLLGFGSNSGTR